MMKRRSLILCVFIITVIFFSGNIHFNVAGMAFRTGLSRFRSLYNAGIYAKKIRQTKNSSSTLRFITSNLRFNKTVGKLQL